MPTTGDSDAQVRAEIAELALKPDNCVYPREDCEPPDDCACYHISGDKTAQRTVRRIIRRKKST